MKKANILWIFTVALCFTACDTDSGSDYNEEITQSRKALHKKFLKPGSPLSDKERKNFIALNYFPPNRQYKVGAEVEFLPEPEPIEMATSTGEPRPMLKRAKLHFTLNNESRTLTVFEPVDEEDPEWFLPFTDLTSGVSTYGGGRYLDLPPLTGKDSAQIDFNLAYNPYCHYSPSFSCPVPPRENDLQTEVQAGEKIFR